MKGCSIYTLEAKGDDRGWMFSLPEEALSFLGQIQETHIGTVEALKVRGNHYHPSRKEVLFVQYASDWVFYWQWPDAEMPQEEMILGHGAVVIEIPAGMAHALYNSGQTPLLLAAFSDRPHKPGSDDTRRCPVF